jgi:hypothetical protein
VKATALALVASALVAASCASSGTSALGDASDAPATSSEGGGTVDTSPTDPSRDASAADADVTVDAGAFPNLDGCGVRRSATAKTCDESCGARLTLPAGGSFCTIECAHDSDCAAPLSGLLCPETIGACVPSCTTDASCIAAGFLRCDAQTKACDTL